MVDYSKLSDKEINKLVAFALGCKEVAPDIFMSDDRRYEFDKPKNKSGNKFYFDPCNEVADAWPIIVENKITVHAPMRYDEPHRWLAFDVHDSDTDFKDTNPLRAAMIVFLMMQDAKNG